MHITWYKMTARGILKTLKKDKAYLCLVYPRNYLILCLLHIMCLILPSPNIVCVKENYIKEKRKEKKGKKKTKLGLVENWLSLLLGSPFEPHSCAKPIQRSQSKTTVRNDEKSRLALSNYEWLIPDKGLKADPFLPVVKVNDPPPPSPSDGLSLSQSSEPQQCL